MCMIGKRTGSVTTGGTDVGSSGSALVRRTNSPRACQASSGERSTEMEFSQSRGGMVNPAHSRALPAKEIGPHSVSTRKQTPTKDTSRQKK